VAGEWPRELLDRPWRAVGANAALAGVYFAGAKLGLSLTYVHPSVTAVWPPTGIALAAVLLLGTRVWPGIALGAFLANVTTAGNVGTSLAIACGNTLEAVVGAWMVTALAGGAAAFERPRTLFRFLLVAAGATAISATVGVTSLAVSGFAEWHQYSGVWLTWWLGDMVSAVIVTPLIVICARDVAVRPTAAKVAEGALLGLLVLGVGIGMFGPWRGAGAPTVPLTFLCIPPMIWAAMRFGAAGTVIAALGMNCIATWGTLHGYGAFTKASPNITLPLLQVFMGVVTVTGLALSAAVREQRRAERELAEHRDSLQIQVEHRTRELTASQEQLRTAERMSSLGTLAAGLAHDMGNLLLPIRVQLDSLGQQGLSPRAAEHLDSIGECVEYLGRLTKGLRMLALAPSESGPGALTDLRSWWGEASGLLKAVVPSRVELHVGIPDAPAAERLIARISTTALTQITLNLLQNAVDAIKDRPHARIEVRAERGAAPGTLRLIVCDNGPGMTEEVRRRCMEPFFTTKPRGMSTGLGLSLVHSLVREARGTIDVDSAPGKGATFTITVPSAVVGSGEGGRPRALVSVTEERTRGVMTALLSGAGYEVTSGESWAGEQLRVWVTDARVGIVEAVGHFLAEDERRRVVFLGEPDGLASSDRVVMLPTAPSPAAARHAFMRLVQAEVPEATAR
jgi:signal transduction histidine kinase